VLLASVLLLSVVPLSSCSKCRVAGELLLLEAALGHVHTLGASAQLVLLMHCELKRPPQSLQVRLKNCRYLKLPSSANSSRAEIAGAQSVPATAEMVASWCRNRQHWLVADGYKEGAAAAACSSYCFVQ
jgi:hypothetical protein